MGEALARWQAELAGWAIPPEILAAAPESPWGFSTAVFAQQADVAVARAEDSPSDAAARAALPAGGQRAGRRLRGGCGRAAADRRVHRGRRGWSGSTAPPGMLEAFAQRAAAAGVEHLTIEGPWPDVAAEVPPADVVVCHHVLYNVADLVPFCAALTERARRRVVVELTGLHPLYWLAPIWRAVHGSSRPEGPTAHDAWEALRDAGIDATIDVWPRDYALMQTADDRVAFVRRRLCVGPERDAEIARLLDVFPPAPERDVATLVWEGGA